MTAINAMRLANGSASQAPKRPNQRDKIIRSGISEILSRKKSKNMARIPLPNPKNIFIKITIGAIKTSAEAKIRKEGVAIATNAG